MTNEQKMEVLLRKIVLRANRAEKAGSTEMLVRKVPDALIQEARGLLGLASAVA